MPPLLLVVIATKNRAEAIQRYALPSLEHSELREFVCVVWDASDDDSTRRAVECGSWNFKICYSKAQRPGSSSQRNDAVQYILDSYPETRYIVFMDDDSELSHDALRGVTATFRESGAKIVNILMKPFSPPSFRSKVTRCLKRLVGMNRHGATSFLYNYGGGEDEIAGQEADWASTCGMGVDISVFRELRVFFPEAFQRFGGYALGEDFAFSFFIFKKGYGSVVNSLYGHFYHYLVGSARLNIEKMAASKWYNFHLLFDAIYNDAANLRPWWLKARFKLFMYAAALKLLIRARSVDLLSVLKGIFAARAALRQYYHNHDARSLMYERGV